MPKFSVQIVFEAQDGIAAELIVDQMIEVFRPDYVQFPAQEVSDEQVVDLIDRHQVQVAQPTIDLDPSRIQIAHCHDCSCPMQEPSGPCHECGSGNPPDWVEFILAPVAMFPPENSLVGDNLLSQEEFLSPLEG